MNRQVWRLAGPMILSNLSIPLLGIVDTAVMGHLPDASYIGAVAIGAMIFSFIFWGFGFLRMSTTGLTAQAVGAGDAARIRHLLVRAALLAIVIGGVLVLLMVPLREAAFAVIDSSAAVETKAREYFSIRVFGAPATLLNYVLIGWFLGLQSARAPLIMLLTINGVNAGLDVLFVLQFGMAADGVAWASVCAEVSGLVVGLSLLRQRLRPVAGPIDRARLFRWREIVRELAINRDIFLRTLCLIFAFAFFTQQGAKSGDVILAANAILLNLQSLMAYGLDGFAHAAEALVGRAIGEKSRTTLRAALTAITRWSVAVAILATGAFVLSGQWLVALMTDLETVRAAAITYLPWMIVSPLVSVWSFVLDGVFIGASRGADMRNGMFLALAVFLGVWWLAAPWGNHGLWLAFLTFLAARAVTLAWLMRRRPLLGN